jgi:hypothetical protein
MKILCECQWQKDETGEDGEPVYERGEFLLLHWGLQNTITQTEDDRMIAVSYTVGICEDCKTGQIRCFLPESIRILGRLLGKE